ncbi:MAG: hypothetical protein R3C04_11635 [Hyphomonas sp.]
MLAAPLDWPQGTFAYKIEKDGDALTVTREVDGGLQTVKLALPAIADGGPAPQRAALCVPAEHHEGKKKEIAEKSPADYGVDISPRLSALSRSPNRRCARLARRWKTSPRSCRKLKTAGVIWIWLSS